MTSKYFTTFPRGGIDLAWKSKGWTQYPYDDQHNGYGECWAENFGEEITFVDSDNTLNKAIAAYAKDTENPKISYEVALIYDSLSQTAAAISFFLRCAERTTDNNLAYECLLRIALCFERQGGRNNTVRGILQQALVLLPRRPEAYFLLARFHERTGDHVNGYTYAELGLQFADDNQIPLLNSVEYPGKYGLIFEKSVSAWWWGRPTECRKLLHRLKSEYKMDENHVEAVNRNIARIGNR